MRRVSSKGQALFKTNHTRVPATMTLIATDRYGYYQKLTKHVVLKIVPPFL
jgi:hypothetical protein